MRSSRTDFHAKGEALQELDHVSIMKPITKFAATVPHTQRIPEIISMHGLVESCWQEEEV